MHDYVKGSQSFGISCLVSDLLSLALSPSLSLYISDSLTHHCGGVVWCGMSPNSDFLPKRPFVCFSQFSFLNFVVWFGLVSALIADL
ncbi:hypothetical protein F8388_003596 [Cannabis sativa]|uniref:Uncharacterized protein n=1 Tax=Cannabis sativa TaxID=3483 RepID=A0A7J6EMG2_CANSA|nr:hypothetical protein F8388_003596 [Cannabis sativa]